VHSLRQPAGVPSTRAAPRRPDGADHGRRVRLAAWQVECRRCGRQFVPVLELSAVAAISGEVWGWRNGRRVGHRGRRPNAARLLAELAGIDLSARSVRRDTLRLAPGRIGPETLAVPVLALDGTGDPETRTNRVELHLAVGLVARGREGGRTVVKARLSAPPSGSHGPRWPRCSPECAPGW